MCYKDFIVTTLFPRLRMLLFFTLNDSSALQFVGLIRPVLCSFLDSVIILANLISVIGGQYAVA